MSNDTKILFSEQDLTVAGMDFKIKPFTFGQLPKVMKLMEKLAVPARKAYETGTTSDPATIFALFAEGGDELIGLMAETIKVPKEFVQNLDQDEGIKLLAAFIEVNKDFFIQRVLPLIQEKLKIGQK